MKSPPLPNNEQARLEALLSYDVLDSAPEVQFDALTRLAARLLDVPIALVSLVDLQRQWFKSRHGLEVSETSREISFCGHVVAGDAPLIIEDACQDERFADNPLVTGEPRIRFYAGMPLRTPDGFVLGTLCTIDHRPRTPGAHALTDLQVLADQVIELLELRRQRAELRQQIAFREAAEAALQESEASLRAVFDSAADAIVTMDGDGVILGVNPAVASMFGYGPAELLGQSISALAPLRLSDRPPEVSPRATGASSSPAARAQDVTALRKDGTVFHAEATSSRFRVHGQARIAAFIRDVSERRRLERLKNQFVSTVSHELRTPLASIRGALGLLEAGVAGELNDEAQQCVGIALTNTHRLIRLTNDILDSEQLESGLLALHRTNRSLVDCVFGALDSSRGLALAAGVELRRVGLVPEVMVSVDEHRFEQVLTNLISNAVKFSPANSPVEVLVEAEASIARVFVCDHGPGVPEEFVPRMFQRFAQADCGDARPSGGSGLGLSISRALMERMSGRIEFRATPGGGATFIIEVPVALAS